MEERFLRQFENGKKLLTNIYAPPSSSGLTERSTTNITSRFGFVGNIYCIKWRWILGSSVISVRSVAWTHWYFTYIFRGEWPCERGIKHYVRA